MIADPFEMAVVSRRFLLTMRWTLGAIDVTEFLISSSGRAPTHQNTDPTHPIHQGRSDSRPGSGDVTPQHAGMHYSETVTLLTNVSTAAPVTGY